MHVMVIWFVDYVSILIALYLTLDLLMLNVPIKVVLLPTMAAPHTKLHIVSNYLLVSGPKKGRFTSLMAEWSGFRVP